MLAETVKVSVPSTRRSSNTSMTIVMTLRSFSPISNVILLVRKQKSPAVGVSQSVTVEEKRIGVHCNQV